MLLGLLIALLPVLVCASYATLHEPYRPVFRRHRVQLPHRWPPVSILHISDLHVRRGDRRLHRVQCAALAGLAPDLLCVTGDVCEKVADIDLLIDLLRLVRPRFGTYIVLGNHEHNAPPPENLRRSHATGWRRLAGLRPCVVSWLRRLRLPGWVAWTAAWRSSPAAGRAMGWPSPPPSPVRVP